MTDQLEALKISSARLRSIVEPLDGDELRAQAYPTEWSVADVLSHLGSGATIMRTQLDAQLAGNTLADDFAQPIWAEWNAKSPEAQATDALAADQAFIDRVEALSEAERSQVVFPIGPMQLDLAGALGMRLNEHALHTWDVEVVVDPNATVPADAAGLVVDNLGVIVRFAGKPVGASRELHVRTSDPARDFALALGPDGVALAASTDAHEPDLELPAEAFARLVYGRLDADHTPAVRGHADLAELRRAFPGF